MKFKLFVFLIVINCYSIFSQDSIPYFKQAISVDFSKLWYLDSIYYEDSKQYHYRPEPIGFIGNDYKRFQIHFNHVKKSESNPYEYAVNGKSKVKSNICNFNGLLKIMNVYLLKSTGLPYTMGTIQGNYLFSEDPKTEGSGLFKGNFITYWYYNKKKEIMYNALESAADGYCNNQFEGNWQSYKSTVSKRCNWGDFRVPDCGDLDVGAGEFGINGKYKNNGWNDFQGSWNDTVKHVEWWK